MNFGHCQLHKKQYIMKTILIVLAVLMCSSGFSQTQVQKFFGERFVSVKEAKTVYKNLPDSLPIPYPEKKLMNDDFSWLVPIIIKGVAKYVLVRPSYLPDQLPKGFDTLDMVATAKVIYLMHDLRPDFPNRSGHRSSLKFLYRTKENCQSKNDLSYKQTIAYNLYGDHNFFALALPKLMESGILEPNYISFMLNKNGGGKNNLYFEFLDKSWPEIKEQRICVLTMIYAK